jgi:glutaredoxin
MKGFLSVLIIVGGLTAGWLNRDKISNFFHKPDAAEVADSDSPAADAPKPAAAAPVSAAPRGPAAAPNPAREAQAKATAIYPGLAVPNSALNQKFVALYKEAQASDPALLSRDDWPLTLAERSMVALGGSPLPRNTVAAAANPQARSMKQVVIYTTSHCPYCKQAKQYFAQKGIPYREVDVETSLTGKEAFRKLGGNGVPLIMVGDKKVDGFNAQELDRLLL